MLSDFDNTDSGQCSRLNFLGVSRMKKYGFTGEVRDGLKRIVCLTAFSNIAVGEVGGWIASEKNLSQCGDSWVFDNARVFENARVFDNAQVYGNACVFENAEVYGNARVFDNAQVYGNACVFENAQVYGNAWLHGNAKVSDYAQLYGDVRIYDDCCISGNALIFGDVYIFGDARIFGSAYIGSFAQVFCIQYIGSRNSTTTFFSSKSGQIFVSCGCFSGNIDEFAERVVKTHGSNMHAQMYGLSIEMAKLKIRTCKYEELIDSGTGCAL